MDAIEIMREFGFPTMALIAVSAFVRMLILRVFDAEDKRTAIAERTATVAAEMAAAVTRLAETIDRNTTALNALRDKVS